MRIWVFLLAVGAGVNLGFLVFVLCFKSLLRRLFLPQRFGDEERRKLFSLDEPRRKRREAGEDQGPFSLRPQGQKTAVTSMVGGENLSEAERRIHPSSPWEELVFNPVYLQRLPRLPSQAIGTEVVIGPCSERPLKLKIPIVLGGMGYKTALRAETKQALALGTTLAGTAANTGSGPFLSVERSAAEKLILQFSKGAWDKDIEVLGEADAIEIQLGSVLPGAADLNFPLHRLTGKVRLRRFFGIEPEKPVIISSKLLKIKGRLDLGNLITYLRRKADGVPVGVKIGSTQWLERELELITEAGPDFVAVVGMEGAQGWKTSATCRELGIPTLFAISRARRFLQQKGLSGKVTLLAGGGLRRPSDFLKAMALGAEVVFVGTAALDALCSGEDPGRLLRIVRKWGGNFGQLGFHPPSAAEGVEAFLKSSVREMQTLAFSMGRRHLREVIKEDLSTGNKDLAASLGISWYGAPEEVQRKARSICLVEQGPER